MGYLVNDDLWNSLEEGKFSYYHNNSNEGCSVCYGCFDYFAMCLFMLKEKFLSEFLSLVRADKSIDLKALSDYFGVPVNRVKDRIYSLGYKQRV